MPIDVKVETVQIVGDDTLRVDLSFTGIVRQDGKELALDHVRQTVYVSEKRGMQYDPQGSLLRSDPRQKGKQ